MTQYYQIRPKPEHYVPVEQWGMYGVITGDAGNARYAYIQTDTSDQWAIHKDALVPVFEPGLVAQLDRLFGDDEAQHTAPPKPSPQPLNESADAVTEPTVYDDLTKRMEALEKRVKNLEGVSTPWTKTFPYPHTSGGMTMTTENFRVINARPTQE